MRRPLASGALLATLLGTLGAVQARAQSVDTVAASAALNTFGANCRAVGEKLWRHSLCGPHVLVHPPTRTALASRPDPGGAFAPVSGVYAGRLPDGMMTANTAVEWGGQTWAMVLLPLPADEFARLSLLAHEAFHRIQSSLGFPGRDAQSPHLDQEQGRLWLRMELRALAAALRDDGARGDSALHDALHFRAHRHHLYPGADTLEALLERHEGLAEYTGVKFAMAVLGVDLDPVLRGLDRFERRRTYVRSFGYATGPALGLLLDRHAPGWRVEAGQRPLAQLLADAVSFDTVAASASMPDRATPYGYEQAVAEESERAYATAARLADIHARLVAGPVVLLEQTDLRASFNPNELVPLPDNATYYPTGTFQASWGTLSVTGGGAVVAGDWRTVRVPAAAARMEADGRALAGDGWKLELATGWTARPDAGGGWRVVEVR
jgi:hypothetical protein